ncbi:MAG: lysylphosphatidylglycerol synthase transmembrane domain-containing protein [Bacteroidota bacterium]
MKKVLVTILQYVIFLGLGIWIVYHMLHGLTDKQTTELIDAIASINAWYLIPIAITGFLSHLFRALRWRYLLETVDMKPTVVNTTFSVLIGYIANLALPRAGEVAKCTVLAKYEKMPAHKMIGTIVAERAFDIVCLIVIAVAAFVMQAHTINEYVASQMGNLSEKLEKNKTVLLLVLGGLIVLITALVMFYRRNRETKFGRFIKEMTHGVMSIIHMKKRWQFMGYTVLLWLMYLAQLYIGMKSLPDTTHLTPLAALVVLVYGSIGMIITPGGIGMYTLMVAQILAVYNIPDIPAQAFGWIAWSVQTALIIILGVVALVLIHPYNKRRDAKAAVDTR